ncbi:hypothetical protein CRENBAI_002391 [Crenichthys baileyi]|uniref:Uncharacterized protein n=1 Tax=Crenichthys baileyi TaxID=28760 RepID=A0AAV9S227_9TELE
MIGIMMMTEREMQVTKMVMRTGGEEGVWALILKGHDKRTVVLTSRRTSHSDAKGRAGQVVGIATVETAAAASANAAVGGINQNIWKKWQPCDGEDICCEMMTQQQAAGKCQLGRQGLQQRHRPDLWGLEQRRAPCLESAPQLAQALSCHHPYTTLETTAIMATFQAGDNRKARPKAAAVYPPRANAGPQLPSAQAPCPPSPAKSSGGPRKRVIFCFLIDYY